MSVKIKIMPDGQVIEAEKGDFLADRLSLSNHTLLQPCAGIGLCGKCRVQILSGDIPEPSKEEILILDPGMIENGYRLACLYQIKGDITVQILEESLPDKAYLLKIGLPFEIEVDPAIKKFHIHLPKPKKDSLENWEKALKAKIASKKITLAPDVEAARILRKFKGKAKAVIYEGAMLLNIEPPDASDKIYGLAVDVGTTTVTAELIDLNTGDSLATESVLNSQIKYGTDIITRISYATSSLEQAENLKQEIRSTLNGLVKTLLSTTGIDPAQIYEMVISGNTTMNHLLLGIPVHTLASAPYLEVFTRLPSFPAEKLGIKINNLTRIYFAPNIHSFIGGDISSGLTASRFWQAQGNLLYIDLGTNGEIVLKTKDSLTATSAAAGPAFEGMNISCGMPAFPGAIYKIDDREGLFVRTIADQKPKGICGTGLIDIVAMGLKKGTITKKGMIKLSSKKIPVSGKISLTQSDIREVQLAASAIKTAIKMLLKENRMEAEELDRILIAGAFGNYLNIQNTMKLGILPTVSLNKVTFIGNASLAGAQNLLLSQKARKETEAAVDKIRFLSLASDPEFQNIFLKSLDFAQ